MSYNSQVWSHLNNYLLSSSKCSTGIVQRSFSTSWTHVLCPTPATKENLHLSTPTQKRQGESQRIGPAYIWMDSFLHFQHFNLGARSGHVSRSPRVSLLPHPDSSKRSILSPLGCSHPAEVLVCKWVIVWTLFSPSVRNTCTGFSCCGHFSCFLSRALSSRPSWDLYQPWFIWYTISLRFSLSSSLPSVSLCLSPILPLLLQSHV